MSEQAKREQFIELRSKGTPLSSIASELNVPLSDIIELSANSKEIVRNRKAIITEESDHATYLNRESRIQLLQLIIERLRDEVMKRDLSDVSTDKILALVPKFTEILKDDERRVKLTKTIVSNPFLDDVVLETEETTSWEA